jgi:ribosomal protein S18 acetylase RimI-like enzyme
MKPIMRRYGDEEDYWRIRGFLREVMLLNGRRERSWHVCRFDYWRWHGVENLGHGRLEEDVFIWEKSDGEIAAVLNREGPGNAFLQVHPGTRTSELEEKMIAVAEEHLAHPDREGRLRLAVWADEDDELRRSILRRRGYAVSGAPEYKRRRELSAPIPEAPVAEGYEVRPLGGVEELNSRSYASWTSFHPDAPDEEYEGWGWYLNIQRAPLYRRDLDVVAIAPGGEVASFCTIWFDDVTRTAYFEPVGTASAHQRRGLARAVMCEGLRRLKRVGGTRAFVGSYVPAAHALYASVGFREYDLFEPWVKQIKQ